MTGRFERWLRRQSPWPESDDPQIVAFVDELARAYTGRARDDEANWDPDWLIWSGPVPAADDDLAAANALVQRRWWFFNGAAGGNGLREVVDEERVVPRLAWHIGHEMVFDNERMPQADAIALADRFVSLVPEPRRWFTNFSVDERGFPDRYASSVLTDFTFEAGFVAIAEGRAWLAWFVDED